MKIYSYAMKITPEDAKVLHCETLLATAVLLMKLKDTNKAIASGKKVVKILPQWPKVGIRIPLTHVMPRS